METGHLARSLHSLIDENIACVRIFVAEVALAQVAVMQPCCRGL